MGDKLPQNEELGRVFKKFSIDENGDINGKIGISELKVILDTFGSTYQDINLEKLMSELDRDGDGFIDFNDVKVGVLECQDKALKTSFDFYDKNKDGMISDTELHSVMQSLGMGCSIENVRKMIAGIDETGDGVINFEEFKKMMMKGLGL